MTAAAPSQFPRRSRPIDDAARRLCANGRDPGRMKMRRADRAVYILSKRKIDMMSALTQTVALEA